MLIDWEQLTIQRIIDVFEANGAKDGVGVCHDLNFGEISAK